MRLNDFVAKEHFKLRNIPGQLKNGAYYATFLSFPLIVSAGLYHDSKGASIWTASYFAWGIFQAFLKHKGLV